MLVLLVAVIISVIFYLPVAEKYTFEIVKLIYFFIDKTSSCNFFCLFVFLILWYDIYCIYCCYNILSYFFLVILYMFISLNENRFL